MADAGSTSLWRPDKLPPARPQNEDFKAPWVMRHDRGDRDRFGPARYAAAADISARGAALCGSLVRNRQVSELVPAEVRSRYVRRLQPDAGWRAAGGQPL